LILLVYRERLALFSGDSFFLVWRSTDRKMDETFGGWSKERRGCMRVCWFKEAPKLLVS
jgi:hypothetical protein